MRKLFLILLACLFLTGMAYAQQDPDDPGIQDSLIIDTNDADDHVDSSGSFQNVNILIYAVTDDSVMFYTLPLKWTAPAGGCYFGTGTQYFSPLTTWDEHYDTVMTSQNYARQVGWADLNIDTTADLPLMTNGQRLNAWYLRFVVSPNTRSQLVTFDTTWDDRNGSALFGLIDGSTEITPAFQRGFLSIGVVGIDDNGLTMPEEFALMQNYPNPFNPETNIDFSLPKEQEVSLVVFNLLGQQIRTLVSGALGPGQHTAHWDGHNDKGAQVPSGVYFYRLYTSEFSQTNKMVLVR
jgi:hypothetical protein